MIWSPCISSYSKVSLQTGQTPCCSSYFVRFSLSRNSRKERYFSSPLNRYSYIPDFLLTSESPIRTSTLSAKETLYLSAYLLYRIPHFKRTSFPLAYVHAGSLFVYYSFAQTFLLKYSKNVCGLLFFYTKVKRKANFRLLSIYFVTPM